MAKENQLPDYLKRSLDLENYDIIRIISFGDRFPAVVLRDKRADAKAHWCIQHKGNGYYFRTFMEAANFCAKRNWI